MTSEPLSRLRWFHRQDATANGGVRRTLQQAWRVFDAHGGRLEWRDVTDFELAAAGENLPGTISNQ